MTPQETINKLLRLIDNSVNDFVEGLSPIQEATYKKVLELIKGLEITDDGLIKNNLANINVSGRLKSELEKIILNDKYLAHVKDFVDSYHDVQQLQHDYFDSIGTDFKEKKSFEEVKKNAIETTVNDLTESGIAAAYIDEIKQIITTAIVSGSSYSDLTKQLSKFILGNG